METGELIRAARDDAGLTQAELARRARTSQPAVARYESGRVSPSVNTLERLLRAAGRSLELSTNEAPSVDLEGELAARLASHRIEILERARRSGVVNVRLFGSVVRGTSTPTSDIDLLVDFDVNEGLLPIIELREELTELLGTTVDVSPVQLLTPEVAASALAEAIPL